MSGIFHDEIFKKNRPRDFLSERSFITSPAELFDTVLSFPTTDNLQYISGI